MGLDMTMNRLPAPTWNWLHVNEASLAGAYAPDEGHMEAETPETIQYHVVKTGCIALNDGTSVNDSSSNVDAEKAADAAAGLNPASMAAKLAQIPGGVGSDMEELKKQGNFDLHLWTIARGVKESEPVRLHFRYENGGAAQNAIGVYAQEDSEITVVMDFRGIDDAKSVSKTMEGGFAGQLTENVKSEAGAAKQKDGCENNAFVQTEETAGTDEAAEGLAAIQTKIFAEKGAKVTLVQIQNLEDGFTFINDVGASCAEGAKMESIQIVLGGGDTYMGLRTNLGARSAALESKIGYLLDHHQKLDVNYLAYQTGAKTTSRMDVSGVLRGASQKLFRGTIDFRKGSEGAKGDEKEDVLLFSDDVVNRTVPLILCEEEDVEGNHGATIGRLDESLLFYLSSRGIDEKEIYEMMARARIDAICSGISDEKTHQMVQEFLA
ncbi:MAG: SufD family Fe-S cluster assembly protein [Lachnospiraceae bacterium]|nr:SufD family Fe-S cluster assembly protein [Lachnospiraceae bacterium]